METYYESRKEGDFKLDPGTILSLLQANGKDILNQMFAQLPYTFWLPIRHETLEGVFVNKISESTKAIYVFENETGVHALISTPSLDEGMALAHFGDRLRIIYRGVTFDARGNRCPSYQLFRNRWTALSSIDEEAEEDDIPLL